MKTKITDPKVTLARVLGAEGGFNPFTKKGEKKLHAEYEKSRKGA